MLPKLMIIGYARHGKDTVCEILRDDYGYTFVSSSRFVGEKAVWPVAQAIGLTKMGAEPFIDFEDFFAYRHSLRAFWYNQINEYNKGDPGRLGRELFAEYPIYCGLRNKNEFNALKNTRAFDFSIWVDRIDSVKAEDKSSCTVEPWMADFVLDNNGSLEDLRNRIHELVTHCIL